MDANDYLAWVRSHFTESRTIQIGTLTADRYYQEVVKLSNTIRIYASVAFKPYVTSWDIQGFNAISFTHSNQKEIPLVNQEGVLSIAVLCGAHIDQEAIDYVSKNPMKHFAAFEIPAVYDLTEGALHHFKKRPLIGYAYYGFIRRYLEQNFDPPKVTPSHGNNR